MKQDKQIFKKIEWFTGEVWFDWDKSDKFIEEQVAKGADIQLPVHVDKEIVYSGDPQHSSSIKEIGIA